MSERIIEQHTNNDNFDDCLVITDVSCTKLRGNGFTAITVMDKEEQKVETLIPYNIRYNGEKHVIAVTKEVEQKLGISFRDLQYELLRAQSVNKEMSYITNDMSDFFYWLHGLPTWKKLWLITVKKNLTEAYYAEKSRRKKV